MQCGEERRRDVALMGAPRAPAVGAARRPRPSPPTSSASIDRVLVEEDGPEGAEDHDRRRRPPEAQVVVGDPHRHHDGHVHHGGRGLDGAAPVDKAAPNLGQEGEGPHHRPEGEHKVMPGQFVFPFLVQN